MIFTNVTKQLAAGSRRAIGCIWGCKTHFVRLFCLLVAHFAHVPNGDGELQLSILPLDLQGDLIPDGFAFDGGEEGVVIGYILAIHLKDDVLGLDPGLTGRAADHHPIYHHAGPEAIDFGILGTYGVDDDADSGTADFAVLD